MPEGHGVRARRRARKQERCRPRVGLALAGGGPLGGIYEVGALLALADSLDGIDSATSTSTSASRRGASSPPRWRTASRPRRCIVFSSTTGPSRADTRGLSSPCVRRVRAPCGAGAGTPRGRRGRHCGSRPPRRDGVAGDTFARRADGNVRQPAIDRFLQQLFAAPGRTNDFRQLGPQALPRGHEPRTGASVIFGAPGRERVPISKAIEASAALPGLFPPVQIGGEYFVDGALNKTLHARSRSRKAPNCPVHQSAGAVRCELGRRNGRRRRQV